MRRFRLRGLEKVNGEALLIAAGQNLKRLLSRRGWGRRPCPSGAAGVVLPALPPLPALTVMNEPRCRSSVQSALLRVAIRSALFQQAASFLGQGATGAIVVIEADVDGHHFRVKRIADTDDSKVFEVHLT